MGGSREVFSEYDYFMGVDKFLLIIGRDFFVFLSNSKLLKIASIQNYAKKDELLKFK